MTVMPSPMLTDRFSRAFEFASVVHATQVRKGTRIPYLSHLLAVASLVIEHGADEDTAIAALLHDAPEDRGGKPMLEQIRARFGERVADTVHGCTDSFERQKGPYAERKTRYVEHLAGDASEETCLVSAADKLHNARSILHDLRAAKKMRLRSGRGSGPRRRRAAGTTVASRPPWRGGSRTTTAARW